MLVIIHKVLAFHGSYVENDAVFMYQEDFFRHLSAGEMCDIFTILAQQIEQDVHSNAHVEMYQFADEDAASASAKQDMLRYHKSTAYVCDLMNFALNAVIWILE